MTESGVSGGAPTSAEEGEPGAALRGPEPIEAGEGKGLLRSEIDDTRATHDDD